MGQNQNNLHVCQDQGQQNGKTAGWGAACGSSQPRLLPNMAPCQLHSLAEALPHIKRRSTSEGEHMTLYCWQEFQALSWEQGLKEIRGHVEPEGDTIINCTYFTALEAQPWVQPIWVEIPTLLLTSCVTSSR